MKRIISVFLILLLLLPAGCKQQDTETAAPGTVVENQVPDAPEQDVPEVVQPEETPSEPAEKEPSRLVDYYVCKFYISLKNEYVGKNYTEANFPEMDITDFSVKTYKYPDGAEEPCAAEFYLTVETSEWGLLERHLQSLKKREDIYFVKADFKAYLIDEKTGTKDFPELYRDVIITQDQNKIYDGVISARLKEGVPPSPSLFSNLNMDGISGTLSSPSIKIYVKEYGTIELSKIIKQLEKNDKVENADYLTKSEIITEID